MRLCYGKVYAMARDGAADADIAEFVMRGVERDIRREGGAPAFPAAVDLLVAGTSGGNSHQLLSDVDAMRRKFADSPLTRDIAAALDTLGLSAITNGHSLTRDQASEQILVHIAGSRCCDHMPSYIARNRTRDLAASQVIVGSVKANLPHTHAVRDLASRMRSCSPKGLPARTPKAASVTYTTDGLNEEI